MDSLDIHTASYLKRNLSFNDTLTGPLRQRNGFAYNSSSYRRKQRMRYQRVAQRYKSVAILGTGIACVLLFALSVIRGGSAGAGRPPKIDGQSPLGYKMEPKENSNL